VTNDPLGYVDPLGLQSIGGTPLKGIIAGGPGEMIGGIAGAIIGAGLGQAIIPFPGGGIIGGIIGGQIGGHLGKLFDPSCAGQLNCREVVPPLPVPQPCGRKCGEVP
jgi:hypothetical protein